MTRRQIVQQQYDEKVALGFEPHAALEHTPHARVAEALDDAWDTLVTIGHESRRQGVMTMGEFAELRTLMGRLEKLRDTVTDREKEWLDGEVVRLA